MTCSRVFLKMFDACMNLELIQGTTYHNCMIAYMKIPQLKIPLIGKPPFFYRGIIIPHYAWYSGDYYGVQCSTYGSDQYVHLIAKQYSVSETRQREHVKLEQYLARPFKILVQVNSASYTGVAVFTYKIVLPKIGKKIRRHNLTR